MRRVSNSTQDQTAGYLASKVQAGANVSLTTVNPGGDEKLEIAVAVAPDTNDKVGATVADTTPDYLSSKLAAGSNVGLTVLNPGGNEQVQIDVTIPPAADELVKATAADTTPDYLSNKLAAGTNITLTVLNPGANEQIQIDAAGGGGTYPVTEISSLCTPVGYTPSTLVINRRYTDGGTRVRLDFFMLGVVAGINFSIVIPDAAYTFSPSIAAYVSSAYVEENSVVQLTPGLISLGAGSNSLNFGKTFDGAGFTPGATVKIIGNFEYDILA